MEVLEDEIRTCRHCGYTGVADKFFLEDGFTYCLNRRECWERSDRKNGLARWQNKRNQEGE